MTSRNLPAHLRDGVALGCGRRVDYAVCRTPDEPKYIYVYKYKWAPHQLDCRRYSWSRWEMGGKAQWMSSWTTVWRWCLDDRTDFVQIWVDELEDQDEDTFTWIE